MGFRVYCIQRVPLNLAGVNIVILKARQDGITKLSSAFLENHIRGPLIRKVFLKHQHDYVRFM